MEAVSGRIGKADRAGVPSGLSRDASQAKPLITCAAYIRDNGITQITFMAETDDFAEGWSVVIGNNRYFGATLDEAVASVAKRMAA